jgi:hypothetical protein
MKLIPVICIVLLSSSLTGCFLKRSKVVEDAPVYVREESFRAFQTRFSQFERASIAASDALAEEIDVILLTNQDLAGKIRQLERDIVRIELSIQANAQNTKQPSVSDDVFDDRVERLGDRLATIVNNSEIKIKEALTRMERIEAALGLNPDILDAPPESLDEAALRVLREDLEKTKIRFAAQMEEQRNALMALRRGIYELLRSQRAQVGQLREDYNRALEELETMMPVEPISAP